MTEADWLTSTDPAAMLEWHQGGNPLREPCPLPPLSPRKLRLYAAGLCRLVWDGAVCGRCGGEGQLRKESGNYLISYHWYPCPGTGRAGGLQDPRSRRAVEVAERYADEGEAVAKEMGRAWLYLDMEAPHEPAWMLACLACCPPDTLAHNLDNSAFSALDLITPSAQADLLRCVAGNPFRPVRLWENGRHPKKPKLEQLYPAEGQEWMFSPKLDNAFALARAAYDDRDWSLLPVLADAMEDGGCDSADLLAHLRGGGPHCRGCFAVDLVLGRE